MIDKVVILFCVIFFCIVSYVVGYSDGKTSGAYQMARHLLLPQFRTENFESIVNDVKVVK